MLKLIFLLWFIVNNIEATLTPKSNKVKENNKKLDKLASGPIDKTLTERKLISVTPTAAEILNNHQTYYKDVKEPNFDGIVLGYVTPWNSHGYDIAKTFGKFTHISPVWLQIKPSGAKYEVTGTHDIDGHWMKDVRKVGDRMKVKLIPRVLVESFSSEDYGRLLGDANASNVFIKTLIDACKKWKFDGYVLEIWPQLAGRLHSYDILIELIKSIGISFQNNGLDLVLVVPPEREHVVTFSKEHFEALYDHVTAFSLMTYDYSNIQRPGPNAPIKWIEKCITGLSPNADKRDKILTGLNFYGNDYTVNGGGAVIFRDYLNLLKSLKGKMQYDDDSCENFFEVKNNDGRHLVFYPTLHSINERIKLIRNLGTGISIWELGQGLDYFYDLL